MATEGPTVCNLNLADTLKKTYEAMDDLYIGDIKDPGIQKVVQDAMGRTKRKLNSLATAAEKDAKAVDAGAPQLTEMMQEINNLNRYRNIAEVVGKATEGHKTLQGFYETARRLNGRVDDAYKRLQTQHDALVRKGFEGQMVGDGTHTPNNVVQQAADLYEDARAGGDKLFSYLQNQRGISNPMEEVYSAIVNGHHKSDKLLNVIGKALKPTHLRLQDVADAAIPGNTRKIREGLNVGINYRKIKTAGRDAFIRDMWAKRADWTMVNSKLRADATQKAIDKHGAAEWASMDKVRRENAVKAQYIKDAYHELTKPREAFHAQVDLPMEFRKGAERAEFDTVQKYSSQGDNVIVDFTRQHSAHLKQSALEEVYGTDRVAGHGVQQEALAAAARNKGLKETDIDELLRYDNSRHDLLRPLSNSVPDMIQRVSTTLNNLASAGYLGKVAIKRFLVDGVMIPSIHRLAYTNSPLRSGMAAIQGFMTSFSSIGQAAVRADAYKTLEHELQTAGLRIRLSNNTVSQHLDEHAKMTTKPSGAIEGLADTAATTVSRYTGADAQYMGHTVDAVVSLGRDMMWMRGRDFKSLPKFASYYFKRNGIGEKEWGLLRKLPTLKAPTFNLNNKGRLVDVMPDFSAIRNMPAKDIAPYQRKLESVDKAKARLQNDFMASFEDALYERFARPTQQDRLGGRLAHGPGSVVLQHLYRFMPIANKQWRGWNRSIRAMSGLDPADSSVRGFFEAAFTSPKAWAFGGASLAYAGAGGMFIELMEDLIAGNLPDKDYFTNPERWAHAIMQTGFIFPLTAAAQAMAFNRGKLQPSVPSLGIISSLLTPGVSVVKEGLRAAKGKKTPKEFDANLKKQAFRASTYALPWSRMWYFQGLMNTFQREQFGVSTGESTRFKEDRTVPWEETERGRRLIRQIGGQ